jgi:hypothetical protein
MKNSTTSVTATSHKGTLDNPDLRPSFDWVLNNTDITGHLTMDQARIVARAHAVAKKYDLELKWVCFDEEQDPKAGYWEVTVDADLPRKGLYHFDVTLEAGIWLVHPDIESNGGHSRDVFNSIAAAAIRARDICLELNALTVDVEDGARTDKTCPVYAWCTIHNESDQPEDAKHHGGVIGLAVSGNSTVEVEVYISEGETEFSFDLRWEIDSLNLDMEMTDLRSVVDQIETTIRAFNPAEVN